MQEKRNLETLRAAVVFSFLSVSDHIAPGPFLFDYHLLFKSWFSIHKKNHVLKKVMCGGSVLFCVPFSGQEYFMRFICHRDFYIHRFRPCAFMCLNYKDETRNFC